MIEQLVEWAGAQFSPEAYLFWTRIQCLAWTAADITIVLLLIRLANLGRGLLGMRRHVWAYAVLAATVPPVVGVLLAEDGAAIFAFELLITVPHFLLILYLMVLNMRHAPQVLRILVTNAMDDTGPQNRHSMRP